MACLRVIIVVAWSTLEPPGVAVVRQKLNKHVEDEASCT